MFEFQINFTDAVRVSNGGKADLVRIRFLQRELFVGTAGRMILDEQFETISYSMGRQMPNTQLSRNVDKVSTQAADSMLYGSILILLGQLLIRGLAKKLIGAIVIL